MMPVGDCRIKETEAEDSESKVASWTGELWIPVRDPASIRKVENDVGR